MTASRYYLFDASQQKYSYSFMLIFFGNVKQQNKMERPPSQPVESDHDQDSQYAAHFWSTEQQTPQHSQKVIINIINNIMSRSSSF
ncbi:hypothetical protein ACLKA6_019850 [Drosophila palustris]